MGLSRLSKIITVRDSFFRYENCAQILQVLQGCKTHRSNLIVVFNFISSEKFFRLTLLTNTKDMLKDFKTCLAFMLQEYSMSCTKVINSILDCTFKSCSGFDFYSHNQKLYFKLDYKVVIFHYEL